MGCEGLPVGVWKHGKCGGLVGKTGINIFFRIAFIPEQIWQCGCSRGVLSGKLFCVPLSGEGGKEKVKEKMKYRRAGSIVHSR